MTGATVRLKSDILRTMAWMSQSAWTWGGSGRTTERRGGRRRRPDEGDDRCRPRDLAHRVAGEDDGQGLGRGLAGADGVEHVGDRGGLGQAEEVRAHEAPGRLGVVAQQGPDLALLGGGEVLEDGEPAFLVEFGDEVGGVVGGHGGEQPGRLGVGPGPDELQLVLGVELLEDVGLELAVLAHGLDDLLALVVGGGLDEVGDLGRMEPGQLPVGDAEAGGGDVGHEGLDAGPVDDGPGPGGDVAGQGPGQQAAQRHAGARVHADDLPAAVEPGDLDLVGPDEAGSLEVDEVAGQEVLPEEELTGSAVEALEVDGVAHQLDPARADVGDAVDGNEERRGGRCGRPGPRGAGGGCRRA